MMIICCSKKSKKGNLCTLYKGHKGKHISTRHTERTIEEWND